jgi:hypothetical protein
MTNAANLPAGQLVRYHGSKADRHGRYRVQFAAPQPDGSVRYDLTYTWYGIYNGADAVALFGVRPESITPLREKAGR